MSKCRFRCYRPRSDASPSDRDRSNAGGILKNGTATSERTDHARGATQVALLIMSSDEDVAIVSLQPDEVVSDLEENGTVVNIDDDDSDIGAQDDHDCDIGAQDCDIGAPNGDSVDDESRTSGLQRDIPMISIQPATPILLSPARSPLSPVSPPSPCDSDEIIDVTTNGDTGSDAEGQATTIECPDEPAEGDAKQVAKKLIQVGHMTR